MTPPTFGQVPRRTGALVVVTLIHVLLAVVFAVQPSRFAPSGARSGQAALNIVRVVVAPPAMAPAEPAFAIRLRAPPALILPPITIVIDESLLPSRPVANAPMPEPAVADTAPGAPTVTERALRDLPAIARQLRSGPELPLRPQADSFSAKLERGIAAAAKLTVTRRETVQLGDGRIMTKVVTNRGSYCYATRSVGLSGGRDVFQHGVGGARSVPCSD